MSEVTTLFWDIGGVVLTNSWDRAARRRAIDHFELDAEDFERRHAQVRAAFELRQMTLEEYLQETVFHHPRSFDMAEFRRFMSVQSQPCRKALHLLEELADAGRYLMATINNESLELNLYRIRHFELQRYFSVFVSSCFVGARKPDREIFRRALELTQRTAGECLFIDERAENLDCARALGMRAIEYRSPGGLREELAAVGLALARP